MRKNQFTDTENEFLKNNRRKMTNNEMAIALGRNKSSIAQRLHYLDNKIVPVFKFKHECNLNEVTLRAAGKRNKQFVLRIRKSIKDNSYINLTVGNKSERCVVLSKGRSSFLIQRRHYKESFNYIEILMGKVKIVS